MHELYKHLIEFAKDVCGAYTNIDVDACLDHPLIADISKENTILVSPEDEPPTIYTMTKFLVSQNVRFPRDEHDNITHTTLNPELETWLTQVDERTWWNTTTNQLHTEQIPNLVALVASTYSSVVCQRYSALSSMFEEDDY